MKNLTGVRAWLRDRPWVWIVLLIVLFMAADMMFVKLAMDLPLEEVAK